MMRSSFGFGQSTSALSSGMGVIWKILRLSDPVIRPLRQSTSIFLKRMQERHGGPLEGSTAVSAIEDAGDVSELCSHRYSTPPMDLAGCRSGFRWLVARARARSDCWVIPSWEISHTDKASAH